MDCKHVEKVLHICATHLTNASRKWMLSQNTIVGLSATGDDLDFIICIDDPDAMYDILNIDATKRNDYNLPLDVRAIVAYAVEHNITMIHLDLHGQTLLCLPEYVYNENLDHHAPYVAVRYGGFYIPVEKWPQNINKEFNDAN